MQYVEFVSNVLVVMMLIVSLIFLSGIVWRVEMKLDISFKLFFAATAFLLVFEIKNILAKEAFWLDALGYASKALFAVLFFWGVMEMRSLLRDVDGERTYGGKKKK